MKIANRIFIIIGCIALLIISWSIVLSAKSDKEKQNVLITQAEAYLEDEIYVLAVPLLEEAVGYDTKRTIEIENMLKDVYLKLSEQRSYTRKYTDLLDKQMNRKDASFEVFLEAAEYYLGKNQYNQAYDILKNGIAKTGSELLITLYEKNRYIYSTATKFYEDVTMFYGTTIQVKSDGYWGIATAGNLIIPCEYDKISTFSQDRAIVKKGNLIYAVNSGNNRVALLKNDDVSDFGNFANDRIPLLTSDGWKRASGNFQIGSSSFEDIGTYSSGYAAAKTNGKWGIVDIALEWLVPPEYDGIIMDELGRSYAQNSVFVKKGDKVYHFLTDLQQLGEAYEDAKPFGNEGYAAVKKNGKWGFINSVGELMIPCQFEDADSFGQNLAAVKIIISERSTLEEDENNPDNLIEEIHKTERWGYINLYGDIVIEPVFQQAKAFSEGSAPVLNEKGWQFISLLEYKKEAGLF